MGVAYAVKKRDMQLADVDPNYRDKVKDLVDGMSLKQLKDFAETKHDGLPEVAENITPANIGGMGPITLPTPTVDGSGDVPAGQGDAKEEYKKKRKKMKHLKTFESFVNEAKVNPQGFAEMFSDAIAVIEWKNNRQKLSTENLLYMLERAWKEVAEQNNYRDYSEDLRFAFEKFKIKTDSKFMNDDEVLRDEAENFGSQAYGETAYHLEGMVDCFCHVIEEFGLVKKPLVKKIREYLLEDLDESVVNESHFTAGDKVECIKSGETGSVIASHGEGEEEIYLVDKGDGKPVEYSPKELRLVESVNEEYVELGVFMNSSKALTQAFSKWYRETSMYWDDYSDDMMEDSADEAAKNAQMEILAYLSNKMNDIIRDKKFRVKADFR